MKERKKERKREGKKERKKERGKEGEREGRKWFGRIVNWLIDELMRIVEAMLKLYSVLWCYVMSCHVTCSHRLQCRVTSHNVTWRDMLCNVMSWHVNSDSRAVKWVAISRSIVQRKTQKWQLTRMDEKELPSDINTLLILDNFSLSLRAMLYEIKWGKEVS